MIEKTMIKRSKHAGSPAVYCGVGCGIRIFFALLSGFAYLLNAIGFNGGVATVCITMAVAAAAMAAVVAGGRLCQP